MCAVMDFQFIGASETLLTRGTLKRLHIEMGNLVHTHLVGTEEGLLAKRALVRSDVRVGEFMVLQRLDA